MEAARAGKVQKYGGRCRAAGIGFSVLAFDTLGATHSSTQDFLKGVFKEAQRREICPDVRYASRAWDRVVVPLQIDVARQLLARTVAPTLECLSRPVFVSPSVAVPRVVPVCRSAFLLLLLHLFLLLLLLLLLPHLSRVRLPLLPLFLLS